MTKSGWEQLRCCIYLLIIINFLCSCCADALISNVLTTIWLVLSAVIAVSMLVIEDRRAEKWNNGK